jgi:hypothetical protein
LISATPLDVAADVLRGIELRLLRKVADADALADEGFADVVVLDAGHDLEQRRLAGAVQPSTPILAPGQERRARYL